MSATLVVFIWKRNQNGQSFFFLTLLLLEDDDRARCENGATITINGNSATKDIVTHSMFFATGQLKFFAYDLSATGGLIAHQFIWTFFLKLEDKWFLFFVFCSHLTPATWKLYQLIIFQNTNDNFQNYLLLWFRLSCFDFHIKCYYY